MRLKLILIFSILLLSFAGVYAQVEVNVKLKADHPDLGQFFDAQQGQSLERATIPATLLSRYSFLSSFQNVQSLLPANTIFKPGNPLKEIYTLSLEGQNASAVLSRLAASGAFEFVEENRTVSLHGLQAEPPNDDSVRVQWYHDYIKTFDAWDLTRGRSDIRIGIIDTGLDYDHPELVDQIWTNPAEDLNGNGHIDPWSVSEIRNGRTGDFDGIDNDGNGYTDDVIGYDFTDQPRSPFGGDYLFPDSDPLDDNSHGTVVSGIIFAGANNTIGGTGIAPDCRLVVLRAFAANGSGEDDDISRAIIYAADNGIKILNFSFGDIYPSKTMKEAIKYAYSRGVIMVGSAGNGTGDELHYPSGFNEVISVSASTYDRSDGREFLWPLSSYGVTVDLCAPGASVLTPTLRDTASDGTITNYGSFSGTSASAPMVTAAVGMLFAHKGELTPQQVRGILTTTTDDISSPGWDHLTGAGRLNIFKALNSVGASNVQIVSPENDGGSAADEIPIIGTILDPQFEVFHIEYAEGVEDLGEWQPILMDQTIQTKEDTLAIWDFSNVPDGEYTLRLRVERTDGFTSEDRIRFIRDTSVPKIEVIRASPVWDNEVRKFLFIFRDEDPGTHVLNFRPVGSTASFKQSTFDRTTRNGEFLLDDSNLDAGDYEFFIKGTNAAGLTGDSDLQTFSFQPEYVNRSGYNSLAYSLPMGRYLPETYDFNGNGQPEVVMSEYNSQLSFGKLKFYEFNGGFFREKDSIAIPEILIPKDVADTDGNGLLELLVSVNDSIYVLEQNATGSFPKKVVYTNFDNGLFAASFDDTDGDGKEEMLLKDFEDYFIYKGAGGNYVEAAKLEDASPGYQGSVAPRALVGDFDGDGKMETVFGDFDGDLIIYEHGSGDTYTNTFLDTTDLTKSASYLTQGDFDGDGTPEIFVAVHSTSLRNDDFEYDTPHLVLRIFKSNGNDSYEVVWEDVLYDIDTEGFNAATAGNIDLDIADELVFSTFPRTYVVDFGTNGYGMQWFFYGAINTHHIIADFNGNGIGEIGLGRGDSTFFWEQDYLYSGPKAVTSLRGIVLGPDKIRITWPESAGATGYQLFQQHVDSTFGILYGSLTGTEGEFTADLISEDEYFYVMRSFNATDTSAFGNFIIRKPHPNNQLDSIAVINERQISVYFSRPVVDREEDKPRFVLNGTETPSSVLSTGDSGNRLILSFDKAFAAVNQLEIDTMFLDAEWGIFSTTSTSHSFNFQKVEEDFLHLVQWEATSAKTAVLKFNYPLTPSALEVFNYTLAPFGEITGVKFSDAFEDAVEVSIGTAVFGAIGYPLSITVAPEVCAINGVCIQENEGDVATFTDFKKDLSEVYTYPNPVREHAQFDGMRFANLTQLATIKVFTASGRFVNQLNETDGDGGYTWDMRDQEGQRLRPGIYLYQISAEGVEEVIGKFSVVE